MNILKFILSYSISLFLALACIALVLSIPSGMIDNSSSYSKCKFNTYLSYYNPGYRLGCLLVEKRDFND